MWFKKKNEYFRGFQVLILPCNQNRKLENLGNMSLTSNSDSSYNSRFKNDKNMNKAENGKVWI